VIKTLYPAIFNTIPLTGPSPSDSLPFTIAALNTDYSKVAGSKPANTVNKYFSETLWPDLVESTSAGLPGSFQYLVLKYGSPHLIKPCLTMA